MITLNLGEFAPEFTLYNQNNKQLSLSNFRGKKNVIHEILVVRMPGMSYL